MSDTNHYKWLDANLPSFFDAVGADWENNRGIIAAHGDKGYGYKYQWEEAGIPFEQGMAVYLLTYVRPFASEARETADGWVDPGKWVTDNYWGRFNDYFETVQVIFEK